MQFYVRPMALLVLLALVSFSGALSAADKLMPLVLGSTGTGDLNAKVAEVKQALQKQGFQLAGEYSPYKDAHVLVVTSDSLKKAAAASDMSGFAAAERVSVTRTGGQIQVAYANPVYMAAAFRLQSDLKDVAASMESALGKKKAYGSKKGLSAGDLKKYHYMFGMPYFDDPDKLNSFGSYEEGVKQVEAALEKGIAGTSKVYRIDIPGKQETLFGVGMTEGFSSDAKIMGLIDNGEIKHTPHLPYEILVSGDKAWALNGKFRIAINFPDLSMMGKGSFMEIMDAPGAIEKVLTQVAKGKAD